MIQVVPHLFLAGWELGIGPGWGNNREQAGWGRGGKMPLCWGAEEAIPPRFLC